MKKFVLTGYYGFGNIGDEAVLYNIISQIKGQMPNADITVLSNDPQQTAAAYGVAAADRWKLGQTFSALRKADMLVLGGGSLLQDVTGKRSLSFYLMQIFLARFLRRKVFLYAQGIGPINEPQNKKRLVKALRKTALITVRDEDSATFLRDLGLPQEKIIVTADPVLAATAGTCELPLPSAKKIALSVRPWPSLGAETIDKLAAFADHFVALGYEIVFLPFSEPQDRALSKQIAHRMKRQAFLPPQKLDYCSMPSAIGQMDLVIGMRLHSLIMSAAEAVPFIGLSYDPKVDSFCRSLQQPRFVLDKFSAPDLILQTQKILAEQAAIRENLRRQKVKWQRLCQANAVLLQKVANKENELTLQSALDSLQ
jgi:polysaccharide pyruvyl transferase CsaB